MDFDQILQICLPQEYLELIWGVCSNNCCHGNTFKVLGLIFVGVPQTKPMYGFSPNFQDMLSLNFIIEKRCY